MSSNLATGTLTDTAWLEAQYDNRKRVPTFAQHFERWRAASAQARAQLACHLDVPFMPDAAATLDVFPAARANAPVLVFIHGGYWRALDKSDFSFVAPPFVASGAMVVVPNHSLCPAVTIDTIAMQLAHAMAWVHRNAARFGGDAARNVVVGHSAGGHLAAMLLACDGRRLAPDLPLRLTADVVRRASPAGYAAPAGATLCSVVGALESDEFLRQNRLIRERWGGAVVPVCEEIAGRDHFSVLDELIDPLAALHRRVQQWLAA